MPTTPNFGLRYPALTDAPNVPTDIKNLAEDVDTSLASNDSGLLSDLAISMSSGWTLNECLYRIISGVMYVRFYVQRSGAQIVGAANGNVADTPILTLNDGSRWPQVAQMAAVRFSNTGGTVQLSDASGVLTLTDLHSAGVIDVGHNGQCNFAYPLP